MNLRTEIQLPSLRGRIQRVVAAFAIAIATGAFAFASGAGIDLSFAIERDLDLREVRWHERLRVVAFDAAYYDSRPGRVVPARRDLANLLDRLADRGARTVALDFNVVRIVGQLTPDDTAALSDLAVAMRRLQVLIPDVPGAPGRDLDPASRAAATVVPVTRSDELYSWAERHPFEWGKDHSRAIYGIRPLERDATGQRVPSWPGEIVRAHARNTGQADPLPGLPGLVRQDKTDPRLPLSATAYLGEPSPLTDLSRDLVMVISTNGFVGEGEWGSLATAGALDLILDQALAVNSLLEAPVAYERASVTEIALTTFVLALLALLATQFIRPLGATVALAAVLGVYGVWVVLQFERDKHVAIEMTLALFFLSVGVGLGLRAWSERRSKESLQSIVDEYVPPAVALALTAERRGKVATTPVEATVLYADVRGYTTLTGELDAADVKAALDIYYSTLGPIVANHGGVLLYYAGDGMVVTFAGPEHPDDHADRALACATEMQLARVEVAYELGKHSLPNLSYGIGLDTGSVVIGPIGSTHHRQYTVLGEAVNIASRMCAIATAGQVCLTESTRVRLRDAPPLVDMGELQLKNVLREIQGWRVADDAVVASAP